MVWYAPEWFVVAPFGFLGNAGKVVCNSARWLVPFRTMKAHLVRIRRSRIAAGLRGKRAAQWVDSQYPHRVDSRSRRVDTMRITVRLLFFFPFFFFFSFFCALGQYND